MAVTYNKLWHHLIDKGMKKKELQEMAELTSHTMLKLRNNQDISLESMLKICKCLDCNMEDIMDVIEIEKEKNK